MEYSEPRVLVASRRSRDHNVWYANAYESEDVISEIAGAEILSVGATDPKPLPLEHRLLNRLERATNISVVRGPRPDRATVEQRYDLFLVRVLTLDDLDFIQGLAGWRERCRVAVCWVEELWVKWLQHERLLEPLKQFDHVLVEQALTAEPLAKLIDRPCHYIPAAIDTLRFCPYPDPPERTIDLYAMGRRGPKTHAAAIDHARKNPGFMYLYDSVKPGGFANGAAEHRELLANLARRSRYFVANRAKVDAPDQHDDQQEFGPRFLEGAAAGAVLIGEPPKARAFDEAFDWPDAVISLDYDSPEIISAIEQLDRDPARIARARKANVINTLRRHDWVHRWHDILEIVDLPMTTAAKERWAEVERRAALVETHASPPERLHDSPRSPL